MPVWQGGGPPQLQNPTTLHSAPSHADAHAGSPTVSLSPAMASGACCAPALQGVELSFELEATCARPQEAGVTSDRTSTTLRLLLKAIA